ncbi:MAG: shikimate kinase [Promethearchaeota archaeon]
MFKDSIALIGFMATGKTLIGKKLASCLNNEYRFLETDQIVVEMVGKSINEIFEEDGEQKFREYEIKACKKVSKLKKVIISCGGGIVLNKKNVRRLRKNCVLILLTASIDELSYRIIKNGKEKRPLIDKKNPKREIEVILHNREPIYNAVADIVIDTTNREVNDIVNEIISKTDIRI